MNLRCNALRLVGGMNLRRNALGLGCCMNLRRIALRLLMPYALTRDGLEGLAMKNFIRFVVLPLALLAVAANVKDIKRYIKIRNM